MAEKFTYHTLNEESEIVVSTKEDIVAQLKTLGLKRGMVVLVQADMEKMGYFVGGVQTLITALMDTVGYEGTIVVPTFTPYLVDPACARESISRMYWKDIRKGALPFDKKLSMPDAADQFANQFLRNEGVVRSYHPLYSFAAWGKYAKLIVDKHPLHFGLNQDSPLGKVVEFDGYVLSLGIPYDQHVIFKLALYQTANLPIKIVEAPIENNEHIELKAMLDYDQKNTRMKEIKELMEERNLVQKNFIATAPCMLYASREAIDLATAYYRNHSEDTMMEAN